MKLIGPIVPVEPSQLPSQGALKASLSFDSRKPLIYAAVSGPKTERTVLSSLLSRCLDQFPSDYETVLSRGEAAGSSAPMRNGSLTTYDWVDDQYELLKAADVVICRAGHGIIMKAMNFGKPMILIPIPDHTEQYGNAKRACKLGLAELVPQKDVSTVRLLDTTKRLLNSPTREKQGFKQATIGTDAVETAARYVMDLAARSRSW